VANAFRASLQQGAHERPWSVGPIEEDTCPRAGGEHLTTGRNPSRSSLRERRQSEPLLIRDGRRAAPGASARLIAKGCLEANPTIHALNGARGSFMREQRPFLNKWDVSHVSVSLSSDVTGGLASLRRMTIDSDRRLLTYDSRARISRLHPSAAQLATDSVRCGCAKHRVRGGVATVLRDSV
jgi:hypothetical protein